MLKEAKDSLTVTAEAALAEVEHEGNNIPALAALHKADNRLLAELGYKAEFRREFTVGRFSNHTVNVISDNSDIHVCSSWRQLPSRSLSWALLHQCLLHSHSRWFLADMSGWYSDG